jgi:uncharacterized iron-regulated membrane protein
MRPRPHRVPATESASGKSPVTANKPVTIWQQWLAHPERVWLRHVIFQLHFWAGAIAAMYVVVMSVSGSLIVYRNELFAMGWPVEWIVDLHANMLSSSAGRAANGIGAVCLTLLCATGAAIWWPGSAHWRRSLTVEWRASFARIMWDLHSALGFWWFLFVLMWGVSGIYLALPDQFVDTLGLDPASPVTVWLPSLHFGRFGWFTKIVWTIFGLAPAILALTGAFICCRRVIFKKPSNPNISSE